MFQTGALADPRIPGSSDTRQKTGALRQEIADEGRALRRSWR
jgi:hypothetical protein